MADKKNKTVQLTDHDKGVLISLGEQYAEIASLPVQKEKMRTWIALNDMDGRNIAMWINEIPWHEMNWNGELTLECKDPYLRRVENTLRRKIFQWKYFPGDMTLDPYLLCQKVINDTGIGIEEDYGIRSMFDEGDAIYSHDFEPLLKTEDDINKIKDPVITYDEAATMDHFQALNEIFKGILDVKVSGEPGFWYAPWDGLITWFGVENGLEFLISEPDFVHKCISRMTDAYLKGLDQYEALGLFSSNNNSTRIGSGGLGYTSQLKPYSEGSFHTKDIWGSSAAQIFASVSPQMHDEFAIQYEVKWMERFGMNYYGCCEPLDNKLDILEKVPNLRKISISPWANLENAVEKAGDRYVLSIKPRPVNFSGDHFDLDEMKSDLIEILEKTKGCNIEILMKDISTVRNDPQRIDAWDKMARELIDKYR